MAFGIIRVKKLKTFASIVGSCRHTFRDSPTPNANSAMTPRNKTIGAKSTAAVVACFRKQLPAKRRKDAVLALEYLITASPEFFSKNNARENYFQDAVAWIRMRHGASNVLSATLHLDETSPHLVVYVLPLTKDGRLSAKEFCGGAKKLSELQTNFANDVAAKFGLVRGVIGSKATHNAVSKFYTDINAPPPTSPLLGTLDYLSGAVGLKTESLKLRLAAQDNILKKGYFLAEKLKRFERHEEFQVASFRALDKELGAAKRANVEVLAEKDEAIRRERVLSADLDTVKGELSQLRHYCNQLLSYLRKVVGISKVPIPFNENMADASGLKNELR